MDPLPQVADLSVQPTPLAPRAARGARVVWSIVLAALPWARAADVTFFTWSDPHYGVEDTAGRPTVGVINDLPGTAYPAAVGGVVATPRGIVMQGDLVDDGARNDLYPAQWANWVADFGVNGEGRCRFPVFEGIGNHDLNDNLFIYQKIAQRNARRLALGLVETVSANGYHCSWDWDGVHFVNLNLFCGNIWRGEADTYSGVHNPMQARDFLVADLRDKVGGSGRPVVVIQHYRPIDDNWWTYSAADKFQRVLQDYNVVLILVGHQGGGINNSWRGIHWASSNGMLEVCRIGPDNRLSLLTRGATGWGTVFQKNIFLSYAASGLPAAVSNGDWAGNVTSAGATLSGKLLHQAVSPTEVTVYWGTGDGGTNPAAWQFSRNLGAQATGQVFTTEVTGLQPWTNYYYRCRAGNSRGSTWAAASIPFTTAGLLPAAWATRFLGCEQRPWGGARESAGTFTVRGSGRNIGEAGQGIDNFQFAYRSLDGDGEIMARIAGVGDNTANPKVGVMLREAATDNSRHAAVLLGRNEGVRFMARSTTGGATSASANNDRTAPCWVKVTRAGNTFTGYWSADGAAWTQAGAPVSIAMSSTILAGLAVCAGNSNSSAINASTFDNVSVTGDNLPVPPSISRVPDQTIQVDGTAGPLAFTVGDAESDPSQLVVTAVSSNPALVPAANVSLGGSGANRTVTVVPLAGASGTVTITLTVDDGTLTTSGSFLLTVQAGQLVAGEWRSVAEHAGAPRALAIADDNFVESRQAGLRRVEVSFSDPLVLGNPAAAVSLSGVTAAGAVTPAALGITVHVAAADKVLAVTFSDAGGPRALPDAAKWRLTLNPAAIGGAGGLVLSPSAATSRVITCLAGDVDGNRRVSALDLNRIARAGAFLPASAASLRADVDGDGALTGADLDAAWSRRNRRADTLATP